MAIFWERTYAQADDSPNDGSEDDLAHTAPHLAPDCRSYGPAQVDVGCSLPGLQTQRAIGATTSHVSTSVPFGRLARSQVLRGACVPRSQTLGTGPSAEVDSPCGPPAHRRFLGFVLSIGGIVPRSAARMRGSAAPVAPIGDPRSGSASHSGATDAPAATRRATDS